MPPNPPGCREILGSGTRLITRDEWAESLLSLGLPDALAALLATAPDGESETTGRAPVRIVSLPNSDQRVVLRRSLHGGALGPLLGRAYLGLGRALREMEVTSELRKAGAPVPEVIAVMGEQIAGPLWAPVVATLFLEDSADGLGYLDATKDPKQRLRALRAAGQAVRRFHDAGGRHADLHVKNLLFRERGSEVEVFVIDLDRARVTPGLTPGERMAQIMRLFRSLVKRERLREIGSRGVATFFGAYCEKDRGLRRALRRRVDGEMRKLALHALRYPAPSDEA